jgi:hypothetical protein
MSEWGPKTTSAREDGEPDGYEPPSAFYGELAGEGMTRLVISVPLNELQATHEALIHELAAPLGLLYRRKVNRLDPKPPGSASDDFVGLELTTERLVGAMRSSKGVIYHDGRCEVWVRGAMQAQVILDEDGVLYTYPDDPAFRTVLTQRGILEAPVRTMADVDYPKRWFHGTHDAAEQSLIDGLNLSLMPSQKS